MNSPTAHGTPDESAILEAIESVDDARFEAFVRTIGDTDLEARVRGMRGDRGAVRALAVETPPDGLLGSAMDAALGEMDDAVLASLLPGLGDGPASSDGPPASRITPYHESLTLRIWRHRREAGMLAAAALVFAVGVGIVTGVRALRSIGGPAAPLAIEQPTGGGPVLAQSDEGEPGVDPGIVFDDPVAVVASVPAMPPGLERIGSVFEAAPLLGTGRVVVYARAGSAARTSAAMRSMAGQEIGTDHSFTVVETALDTGTLASLGLPSLDAPIVASERGAGVETVMPERASWTAVVEREPASLAALRKRLEEAGMTVEFVLAPEPVIVSSQARAADVLWWSAPASAWRRTSSVPVVIDSLPD